MRHPHRKPGVRHHFHSRRSRRFIFGRFLRFFGGMSLLFLLGILVVGLLLRGQMPMEMMHTRMMLPFFLVPVMFLAGAMLLGALAYRRLGTPFADIMSAVDAVASGDLGARVEEKSPGQLGVLERRFNTMVAELERSEQQRRNMTADIAHELRTPLHILQGTLEGMLDGVYETDKETISSTLDETRLLSRLINDLQTLALAEAGQLPLNPTTIRVQDLLEDVVNAFEPAADEDGVLLAAEHGCDQLELAADYDRLYQVLANLVRNALDHTPQGGTITLASGAEEDRVVLTVQDTGEGIPAEDLPYIFDRFWRGDKSRSTHGHGLGLAISRGLVRAHGGSISAESTPGEGTTFRVELPR